MTIPDKTGAPSPQTSSLQSGRRGARSWGAREMAGAAGVAVLMALAINGTGRYFKSARHDPWRPPAGYRAVTYRVTGTAAQVSVSYQPGPYRGGVLHTGLIETTPASTVPLPWSHTEYLPPAGLASLIAVVHGPGEATAEVDVDGRTWQRTRAVGFRRPGPAAGTERRVYGGEGAAAIISQALSPAHSVLGENSRVQTLKP